MACVLPVLLGRMEARSVLPSGFAILSLNTPLCILLSCDPALGQAVRFLPGQQRAFCIPCCLFIFGRGLAANIIFLCSWQIQIGGIVPTPRFDSGCFRPAECGRRRRQRLGRFLRPKGKFCLLYTSPSPRD